MPLFSELTAYGTILGTEAIPCFQPGAVEDGSITPADIFNLPYTINTVAGVTYTFTTGDNQRICEFTSASSVLATIPADATHSFPVGAVLTAVQIGVGRVTFVAVSGVTVRWPKDNAAVDCKIMRAINSSATFRKRAANDWHAIGDLSSS